jgi:signal recognition particle GTPase
MAFSLQHSAVPQLVEQLQVWGQRNEIPVIAQHTGADSASVIFDAIQAHAVNADHQNNKWRFPFNIQRFLNFRQDLAHLFFFRAAAVEQLQVWGQRNEIPVIAQHTGADSASVI